jgi:DNA-binding response OmpR family regulator
VTRLLIVDDEADGVFVTALALKHNGYKIDTTSDPTKALEMFKQQSYDVVVLDVRMLQLDGFTLYEKMREINKNVRVRFFTAFDIDARKVIKERFPHLNEDCFIKKPALQAEIRAKIKSAIERTG